MPESMNRLNIESSLHFNTAPEISLDGLCWHCHGTGKLKAMTLAMTMEGETVRDKDVAVKCDQCNGRGRK